MSALPPGVTRSAGTTYDILNIDLGVARDNVELDVTGDVLSVIAITGELDCRLNEKDEPAIELDKIVRIVLKPAFFNKLFLTNPAQTGKYAILYIGKESSFEAISQRVGAIGILDASESRVNPATLEEAMRDTELAIIPLGEYVESTGTWTIHYDYKRLLNPEFLSNTTNDTLTFRFRGRKIGVIFECTTGCGIAGLRIDGGVEETFDTYSPVRCFKVWYKDGLADSEHYIVIRVTGTKNPSSTNTYIEVMGFICEKAKNPEIPFDLCSRYYIYQTYLRADDLRSKGLASPNYALLTSTPLNANASYTGSWFDTVDFGFAYISVLAMSDQSGTLYVDFSDDQTHIKSVSASLTGPGDATILSRIYGRYVRVRYVNGTTAQTYFTLSRRFMTA